MPARKKPNPFNIPVQTVNFVSYIYNKDEVILQFGQNPTDANDPPVAIAKIGMNRESAIHVLEDILNHIKVVPK